MSVHPPPRARPAAVGLSVVLALVLVAIAVVAVRDLAVSQGWATGTPWSLSVVEQLDGLQATAGLVAAGVVVALLGLVLVVLALKPAPTTHLRATTQAPGDLWFSRAAVAALAQHVADRTPGVVSAEASSIRRRAITVEVVSSQDPTTVVDRVEAALGARIQGLTAATISVRVKEVPR